MVVGGGPSGEGFVLDFRKFSRKFKLAFHQPRLWASLVVKRVSALHKWGGGGSPR
jgi:hypothetical protein